MTRTLRAALPVLVLACSVALTAGLALAAGTDGSHPAPLKKVEPQKACMVNNMAFDKDQIPTTVEGHTYYGCCPMCKEKLEKDASLRSAVDPVSGKKVDKATAVIAAQADGSVLYFESQETLEKYSAPKQ
jgi:YHS domain-containing protein